MVDAVDVEAANAAEFEQAHWKVIAQGFHTEHWFSDNQGVGTGGILMPKPTRLPTGQYYYRFASSDSARVSQLGGGWWVDYEAFSTIARFATQNGYRLRDAARLFLALPYEWTKVDLLVKALLLRPLRAYTGYGKPAHAGDVAAANGNRSWTCVQYNKVRQLYVPGLYVRGRTQQIYETAFQQPPRITQS